MAQRTWMLFVFISLAAILTPGPAMLAILGHALARGARATLPVVVGNACGVVVLIGVSIGGLAAVLSTLPHGFTALRIGGAVYLLWLGVRAFREAPRAGEVPVEAHAAARGLARGLLIAFSNPKALLFFGAVLPQFVDPGRPLLPQFTAMASTMAGLELVVTASVAWAAQGLLPLFARAGVRRGVQRAGGAILIGAAALVALVRVRP